MNFGEAVQSLEDGKLVQRSGWNGKNMFLILIRDWNVDHRDIYPIDVQSYPHIKFIALKNAKDEIIAWNASQEDTLAKDWQVVSV